MDKYKEALEKAKSVYNNSDHAYSHTEVKEIIGTIFPELKETEDERINREITEFLVDFNNLHYKKPSETVIDSWLSWLEKQGGQKNEQKWSEEDEKNINFLCELLTDLQVKSTENEIKHGTNSRSEYYYNIKKWLKSLNPHSSWRPSEEEMIAIQEAINIVGSMSLTGIYLKKLYEDLKNF